MDKKSTGYKLLRGRNIDYYKLVDLQKADFVREDFLKNTKKSDYVQMDRIICQQVANIHKKRRVTFALAPQNYILGNSCNFISVTNNNYGIDIYTLLGLFNTKIINWLFKLTSSNNHINNYEIDCFPIPVDSEYLIAREIKKKTGCCRSIDLFCGAGGMTTGFKAAGIKSLLSNDIEESACATLKINNPEIPVLCGDITQAETKDAIVEKAAKEDNVDIICGEPPCQGFSMAGFRSVDDPRNQLFREFVDIIKRINPKVIVFENVEGLLSYQGGKTYQEVHTLFSKLGYNTEGRTLTATDYAVPQKRKRVIIICTRNDMNVLPSELFPSPITEKKQVTARETIYDLETVECKETSKYVEGYDFDILNFLKKKISYDEYILGRIHYLLHIL